MFYEYAGFDLVDVLPAGAGAPRRSPFQVGIFEVECVGVRLWEDGHGDCRGVDAPAAFSRRNSLPAVAARLVGKRRLCLFPDGLKDDQSRTLVDNLDAKDPSAAPSCSRSKTDRRLRASHHRHPRQRGFRLSAWLQSTS